MDPDIPIQSIERETQHATVSASTSVHVTKSDSSSRHNSPSRSTPRQLVPSKSQSSLKSPRSHPPSPSTTPSRLSPSPSVASLRQESQYKSPSLNRKTSVPNLVASREAQFGRASSNLNPALSHLTVSDFAIDVPAPMSVATVAKDFFQKELDAHSAVQTQVSVFVHDACYGHRFSRPRSSKLELSSIVERPERIHAALLGASTAYVRLGQRHKDGRYGPHPDLMPQSLSRPPFTFKKTRRSVPLNHPAVTHVHGARWMEELQIMCDTAESKLSMNGKELTRPIGYGKDAKGNPLPALHGGDLYLASQSLSAFQGCLGGVFDAVDTVFQSDINRRAFVCIRPPGHHCSSNYPSGFCWLNNVHVGITYAAMEHGLTHAAIIDFDLHHGDGSQTITWDHNRTASSLSSKAASSGANAHKKTPIGYYSLHDINSYPCEYGDEEKVRNASLCLDAHNQSIWNVHLELWKDQEDFWRLYESKYKVIFDKAASFLRTQSDLLRRTNVKPKAAIFLSAGFDASEWEMPGMQRHEVNVPTQFYARFTEDALKLAAEDGLGVDGRVISVLEGGYSDRALASGVLSHICGLTKPLSTRPVSASSEPKGITDQATLLERHYDPSWWAVPQLEALENVVAGHLPPQPKKVPAKQQGTYSSPTQASIAKETEIARERRSFTNQIEARMVFEPREPELAPEVDWTVAAYELSRVMIPSDRQTSSCTHEELNAEAKRARKERESTVHAAIPTNEEKMQLRGRKPRMTLDRPSSAVQRSTRRTTIAAVADLPDSNMRDGLPQRPRRRSSASTVLSNFQDMKLEEPEQTLAVKKSRPRKQAPRPDSPEKPRSSAAGSHRVTTARGTSHNANVAAPSIRKPSQPVHNNPVSGIDELTNGMKKISIKLNLPTEEEHAANQKRAEGGIQSRQPRVARKAPVPKPTKPRPETSSNVSPQDLNRAATEQVTIPEKSSEHTGVQVELSDPPARVVDLTASTVSTSPGNDPSKANITRDRPSGVEHYVGSADLDVKLGKEQSDEADKAARVEQTDAAEHHSDVLRGLKDRERHDANTEPAPSRSTAFVVPQPSNPHLPVFTSSSPIPFAKRDDVKRVQPLATRD